MAVTNAAEFGSRGAPADRLERGAWVYAAVLGLGVGVLAAAAVFAAAVDVDGSFLTREPQVALDGPLYAGTISNLGALVWMLGAVMAFVGGLATDDDAERRMFFSAGSIGTVLLVDDFFMIHDWVSGRSELLEKALIFGYLVAVVLLIVAFREQMGPVAVVGVAMTLVLFAASAGFDFLLNHLDQIVEDGFKFLGICTWAATWTLRSRPWALRPAGGASLS